MFSKVLTPIVAMLVVVGLLSGCAEFNRRGGVVADVEDVVLFTAHTKSHRLFRSYMLIGVLMAAARQGGHNETDRIAINANVQSALAVAFEAYSCLYAYDGEFKKWEDGRKARVSATDRFFSAMAQAPAPAAVTPAPAAPIAVVPPPAAAPGIGTVGAIDYVAPAICQFFDEKMARLDYALFRLALSAMFNEKSNSYLANIRDKLVGEIPVVSASAKAAIFATRAVSQTTNIVDDLLNLSFSSAGPVLTLLPLYRDALEMNMWVIVDSLTRICPTLPAQSFIWKQSEGLAGSTTPPPVLVVPSQFGLDCPTREYAYYILSMGNGGLGEWRDFVWKMNYAGNSIEAYAPHFVLVSQLIWRSCINLLDRTECSEMIAKAGGRSMAEAVRVTRPGGAPPYSASIRSPSQFARDRLPVSPGNAPPASAASPGRDPQTTGSIPRTNTTQVPQSPAR